MDITGTKVLVAVLFGIIRFMFGVLPIKVCSWLTVNTVNNKKRIVNKPRQRLLEYAIAKLQSFGGGVLFATCFLHMIPEVYYSVEELKEFGMLTSKYPFSQLIISFGFFLIYFVEEISHWFISKTPKTPCDNGKSTTGTSSSTSIIPNVKKVFPEITNGSTTNIESDKRDRENQTKDESIQVENENDENDEKTKESLNPELEFEEELNEELEEIVQKEAKTRQQIVRCILIILALSFHAIFEGLAIGLQHSITNIWYLFVAVSIHSATVLFCVGLEIFLATTKVRTMVIHVFFLAVTSPLGVIIGLIININTDMHSSAKSIAVVILEGLSAGTILYITFFEILIREKERRMCRINRAIYIATGFAVMAALECAKLI